MLGNFVHNSPKLGEFLEGLKKAYVEKDADILQLALVSPDRANDFTNHYKFLLELRKELQSNCPTKYEAGLDQSLDMLPLVGWVTIKPVVLSYLRLIRDWVEEDARAQQINSLKKVMEDVSKLCTLVKVTSTMNI